MHAVTEHIGAKILAILQERKRIVLDELLPCLPGSTWNQVFSSVDRLSRRGAICLRRRGFNYELWAQSPLGTPGGS